MPVVKKRATASSVYLSKSVSKRHKVPLTEGGRGCQHPDPDWHATGLPDSSLRLGISDERARFAACTEFPFALSLPSLLPRSISRQRARAGFTKTG